MNVFSVYLADEMGGRERETEKIWRNPTPCSIWIKCAPHALLYLSLSEKIAFLWNAIEVCHFVADNTRPLFAYFHSYPLLSTEKTQCTIVCGSLYANHVIVVWIVCRYLMLTVLSIVNYELDVRQASPSMIRAPRHWCFFDQIHWYTHIQCVYPK